MSCASARGGDWFAAVSAAQAGAADVKVLDGHVATLVRQYVSWCGYRGRRRADGRAQSPLLVGAAVGAGGRGRCTRRSWLP